jgi:carbamate kinase
MRVVIALGGNAILRRGEPMTVANQRESIARACMPLARIAREHELIVSHGNGPQVGLLALQAAAYDDTSSYPFDVLGAQTEGMIGYLLEQELGNRLGNDRAIATVLSRTVVDANDPAFSHPTKPVGPVYSEPEGAELAREHDWVVHRDGDGYRRVVPSPEPQRILEAASIGWLIERGAVVICAGGGGIPVVEDGATGEIHGVEAVVDKDLASAVLADELQAHRLVIATDVPAVIDGWGTGSAREIARAHPDDLDPEDFDDGSMGPKVGAAVRFASSGRGDAVIGSLDDIEGLFDGRAGTVVSGDASGISYRRS